MVLLRSKLSLLITILCLAVAEAPLALASDGALEFDRTDCETVLTATQRLQFIDHEFEHVEGLAPGLHRFVITLMRQRMEKKIFETCEAENLCSPPQVSKVVRENIEEVVRKTNTVRGTGIVLAAMTLGGVGANYLRDSMPDSGVLKIIGFAVQPLVQVILFQVSFPLATRLASRTTHWISKAFEPGSVVSLSETNQEKEQQWSVTQAAYSPNAQMTRSLLGFLRTTLRGNFLDARDALRRGDQNTAIDQIAEAAVIVRWNFADIEPENRVAMLAVRVNLTDPYPIVMSLKSKIFQRIQELDPESKSNPKIFKHYERTLNAWLRKQK